MGPHDGNEVHATLVPPHSIPVSPLFCLPSLQLGQSPHETGHASAAVTRVDNNIAAP